MALTDSYIFQRPEVLSKYYLVVLGFFCSILPSKMLTWFSSHQFADQYKFPGLLDLMQSIGLNYFCLAYALHLMDSTVTKKVAMCFHTLAVGWLIKAMTWSPAWGTTQSWDLAFNVLMLVLHGMALGSTYSHMKLGQAMPNISQGLQNIRENLPSVPSLHTSSTSSGTPTAHRMSSRESETSSS